MTDRDREAFVARFGGIYENSPWVAAEAYAHSAGLDAAGLAGLFAAQVDNAGESRQLALIRAHPDLAGRAAVAGELGAESTAEQASARLDCCTPEEFSAFQDLNRRYKERFGFPFVMAVRGRSRQEILAEFTRRIGNDRETEFRTALTEIHRIARLRLEAM